MSEYDLMFIKFHTAIKSLKRTDIIPSNRVWQNTNTQHKDIKAYVLCFNVLYRNLTTGNRERPQQVMAATKWSQYTSL